MTYLFCNFAGEKETKIMEITTKDIKISSLQPNSNQIEGLPRNPRKISRKKLEQLKKSVKDAPEMLRLRELIAVEHDGGYVVICGNQRLEAAKALGMETLPVKVLPKDTPVEKLREYAIKDNLPFGEDDWEILTSDWDVNELEDWGMDVPEEWKEPTFDELDNEVAKKNDFQAILTFKVLDDLEKFKSVYIPMIKDEIKCNINVKGGAL